MRYLKLAILGIGVVLMIQGCTNLKTRSVPSQSLQDILVIADTHLETTKPEEILVLLDINFTLTYLPQFSPLLMKKYVDVWTQEVKSLSPNQQDLFLCLGIKDNPNIVLDPKALEVLAELQKKGIKTIAFTAALSGRFDGTGPMKVHVYEELKSLGISFEHSFPLVKDVEFTDLKKYYGAHPCYYKGILFANGESAGLSKGDVLVHFLKHMGYTPKVVIIADDRRINITSLEKVLVKTYPHMKLEGLEYLYGYSLPAPDLSKEEFHTFVRNLRAKTLALS